MKSFIGFVPILVSREFGLNTDIFETNVINIAILCFGLFSFVGGILKTSMDERKVKIVESMSAAQKRVQKAIRRYKEAKKQFEQVQLSISEIQKETRAFKYEILGNEFSQTETLIKKQFELSRNEMKDQEQLILYSSLRRVFNILFFKVVRVTLALTLTKDQHNKCLCNSIYLFATPGGQKNE